MGKLCNLRLSRVFLIRYNRKVPKVASPQPNPESSDKSPKVTRLVTLATVMITHRFDHVLWGPDRQRSEIEEMERVGRDWPTHALRSLVPIRICSLD